ncbi:endonuclease-reverse transcriptase [Plakobranchus ocellatus]|uniref:Endonuclease-reverse transcriptase n=1 Tax=Plakobranchus ocellatus TaxID=259542 RepID=A0AAV4BRG5_9GAST|nr:endonuclease-reverse transcriptase [Plakobranchus ocellatus]
MTYGCQTWTPNKQLCHKLQTVQRAMERKILNIKLKDRISTIEIRKKTQVIDVVHTFKDKNGGGQDTLLEKKTIDGLKDAQSGNQGQEEETGADQRQDRWMTSGEQQVHNGRGTHKIGGNGRHLQWIDKASK